MRTFSRMMVLTLLTGLLSIPVAEARTRIYLQIAPPRAVVERVVVAPGQGYAWQPGYHEWNGRAYAWRSGVWVRPPRRHAMWVPGRWVHERRGHYWVAGYWRR
ncbi:MAG TPA: hypothetical protein VNN08_03210 [Thermoanaerobaculia bacterium]|nr:hypothetical protein [Thermoanaerobaculia bacterium]